MSNDDMYYTEYLFETLVRLDLADKDRTEEIVETMYVKYTIWAKMDVDV